MWVRKRVTLLLVWARGKSLWNSLARGRGSRKLRGPLLVLFWGFFTVWVGMMQFELFRGLVVLDSELRLLRATVFGLILGFFIILFLGGSVSATSLLALSGETQYLLSTPVPRSTVFRLRLFEAAFLNGTFVFVFLPSMVVALGAVVSAGIGYYVGGLSLCLLFVILVTDLGTWLSFAVGRALPPRRAREVLSALTGLAFLVLWLALQLLRTRVLSSAGGSVDPGALERLIRRGEALHAGLLPSSWFATSLWELLRGEAWISRAWIVGLAMMCLGLHEGTARLADSLWLRGFAEAQGRSQKARAMRVQEAGPRARTGFGRFLYRESRMLLRDYQQLMRVATLAVIAIVIPFLSGRRGEGSAGTWESLVMSLFLVSLAGVQFAALLIPLEGRAFWLVRIAPGAIRRVVLAKWVIGAGATSVVAVVANVAASLSGSTGAQALWALPACIFLPMSLSALGIIVGAHFARFDWDHPKRALRNPAGLVLTLGAIAAAGFVVLPAAAAGGWLRAGVSETLMVADAAALAEALASAALFLTPAIRKLQKLEWAA